MKYAALTAVLLVIGAISAKAETYLCGDPPPVADESLAGELSSKAKVLSRFLGDAELSGKIKTSRSEVFSRYPNADRVVVDHYLLYQTCLILTRDKGLSTTQKLEELRKMRREFQTAFQQQKIYRVCRHPDFGQVGWAYNDTITQSSGWVGGGSNPTNWCNQLIAATVRGRSIGPQHKATVIDKSEQGKWTGTFNRTRKYNYHCTIKLEWEPVYRERRDPRCGEM
ncbi:MAG: hypothetical protein ACQGVK_18290 [Myxococcota bacterium]